MSKSIYLPSTAYLETTAWTFTILDLTWRHQPRGLLPFRGLFADISRQDFHHLEAYLETAAELTFTI